VSLQRQLIALQAESSTMDAQRIFIFDGVVEPASVEFCISWLLQKAKQSNAPITIRLNTGGGSVTDGLALYDAIQQVRDMGVKVDILGTGLVASMGTVIIQAAETRELSRNTNFMVHEPSSGGEGSQKYSEMLNGAALTGHLWEQLSDILAERSTFKDGAELRKWVDREDKWLTAETALKLGFIDKIV
jgi:ATP-dependent Clp endopeptidase proteolytic subunit ClpP